MKNSGKMNFKRKDRVRRGHGFFLEKAKPSAIVLEGGKVSRD